MTAEPKFPLLLAPYDIRRCIYKKLYPSNCVLPLLRRNRFTPSSIKVERYGIEPAAFSLLRTNRQINAEIIQMLYGTNEFVMMPDSCTSDPSNSEIDTILHGLQPREWDLRPELKQLVKTVYVCQGWILENANSRIADFLVDFPRVVVVFKTPNIIEDPPSDQVRWYWIGWRTPGIVPDFH